MTLPVCSKSPCDWISEPPCSEGKIWGLEVSANDINTVLALAHLRQPLKVHVLFPFHITVAMIGSTLEGSQEILNLQSAEMVQRHEFYINSIKLSYLHTNCTIVSILHIK